MLAIAADKMRDSLHAVVARRQPAEMAWSASLGILIGAIPSSSYLPVLGVMAVVLIRNNLGFTCASALFAAAAVRPMELRAERIGRSLLEADSLQSIWQQFALLPIAPWFSWNNSLVMGTLVVAMAAYPPVWLMAKAVYRQRSMVAMLANRQIAAQVDRSGTEPRLAKEKIPNAGIAEEIERESMVATLDSFLIEQEERSAESDSSPQRRRSVRDRSKNRHRFDSNAADATLTPRNMDARVRQLSVDRSSDGNLPDEAILQETVIEIVRYRSSDTKASTLDSTRTDDPPVASIQVAPSPTAKKTTTMQPKPFMTLSPMEDTEASPKVILHNEPSIASDENPDDRPREEALRYLLWHLSGVKRTDTAISERST